VRLVRPSDAPGRVYELVPRARGPGWGTEVAVNAHGFRGPELPLAAPERVRLVALGDSVTFGNDLALAETWPGVLESLLGAELPVDVLDLGLGGYDTTQEVATLEALGLAFAPAHVVLAYCVNDVGVVSMSMETAFTESERDDLRFASRIAQWLHVWRAERRQRRALYERNREEAYARAFAAEIAPLDGALAARVAALRADVARAPAPERELASRRIPARWYASEARIARLQRALERLAALSARHGFGVTLLLVPYLEEDALIERGLDLVADMARACGFGVVDPRAAFRAAGPASLRLRADDPVHPNAAGHALLARALADALPRADLARQAPGE
jgi:lysophospholipase L1-like esterase